MQAGGQLLQPARRPDEASIAAVPQVVPDLAMHPMGGIGAEPRSPVRAVLIDGGQEPDVALADEIIERLLASAGVGGPRIPPGNRFHQGRHALDHPLLQGGAS